VGLRPRGDPLPLGELIPAALRAEPAAVAGRTGAAERRVRVVVQRLVVDVHDAGVQPLGELETAFQDLVPAALDQQPDARGTLAGARLGPVGVFTVSGAPQVVRRTTSAARRSPGDLIKVCVQLNGRATVQRGGHEVCLDPGELAVYDTGRPYQIRLGGPDRGHLAGRPASRATVASGTVSVVTGAARWIRAAIAPLGPLAGPLPALLLPQTANPYPLYRAVVTEHAIL